MDDETRKEIEGVQINVAEIRVELLRLNARLNAMQDVILQTLALIGQLGHSNTDIRTQIQSLEVYVGVPQA